MSDRMKVLIAYDGSPCADDGLADLSRAGLPPDVEAVVLSVADVWPPSSSEASAPHDANLPAAVKMARAQAAQAVAEARRLAETAAARVQAQFPGWAVTSEAVADSPAWAIIKKAETWQPDLVIMGAHGKSTLTRMVLGSVSQKVLTELHHTIRIARRRERRAGPPRLLVAVDGSPGSAAAVQAVGRRVWPTGTEARVLAVVDERIAVAENAFTPPAERWVEESEMEAHAWVDETLQGAVDVLTRAGLAVTPMIGEGDPKHVLLEEADAWNADCIFVGASGMTRLGYLVMGSVSTAVAARAHCSVEVVRTAG